MIAPRPGICLFQPHQCANATSLVVHRRCWRQFGILTPCRQMQIMVNDRAST